MLIQERGGELRGMITPKLSNFWLNNSVLIEYTLAVVGDVTSKIPI